MVTVFFSFHSQLFFWFVLRFCSDFFLVLFCIFFPNVYSHHLHSLCVCVCLDYSSWQTNEALLLGSSIQPKVFLRQMEARTDRRTPCLDYCCIELADIFPDAIYFCFFTAAPPGGCADHFKVYRCVLLCFFLGRDDRPPSFLSLQLVQFSADVLLGMLIPPYICRCCCSCS